MSVRSACRGEVTLRALIAQATQFLMPHQRVRCDRSDRGLAVASAGLPLPTFAHSGRTMRVFGLVGWMVEGGVVAAALTTALAAQGQCIAAFDDQHAVAGVATGATSASRATTDEASIDTQPAKLDS